MYYRLEGKTPVPCSIDETFSTSIEERRVAETTINESIRISTVFLGVNHGYVDTGPPILFETMVFDDGNGGDMERATTWLDAQTNHINMVNKVLASSEDET